MCHLRFHDTCSSVPECFFSNSTVLLIDVSLFTAFANEYMNMEDTDASRYSLPVSLVQHPIPEAGGILVAGQHSARPLIMSTVRDVENDLPV